MYKNIKALNSSSSGFVVAGTGLFYDPEKGGLTTKPCAHCVSFGLFYFNPLLTSKLDACLKIKKP